MRPASSNSWRSQQQARLRLRHCAQAGLLVCALLLAQLLGLAHGVMHDFESHLPGYGGAAVRTLGNTVAQAPATSTAESWLASIFALHAEGADCRLYDQACHGGTVSSVPAIVLPTPWAHQVFDITRGAALARWAALFDARGPPLPR